MKKNVCLMLPAFLLLISAWGQVSAQPASGPGPLAWCSNLPGLTGDQEAKIKQLQTQHLKDMQAYRNQLNENRARYQTLMTAPQPDMKAINANIEERAKIRTEMEKNQAAHVQAIRQVLTDEQRVYFDQHIGKRKGCNGCGYGAGYRHGFGPGPGAGAGMQHRRGAGWNQ